MESVDRGSGFSVLDGAALVVGSAIASIHILGVWRENLSGAGWAMIGITFIWVAVTAAGPFVYAARRFARRLPNYPKIGDRLWALLGVPWILTAVLHSAAPRGEPRHNPLYATTLSVGLGVVCLLALGVVWTTWVMVPAQQAARVDAAPWTNRVGLVLAIAWPMQCGLGMLVLG
jgi:hypothetical protein